MLGQGALFTRGLQMVTRVHQSMVHQQLTDLSLEQHSCSACHQHSASEVLLMQAVLLPAY